MLYAITGKPGGGKTYFAVSDLIFEILQKERRKVVTNISLNIPEFQKRLGMFSETLIHLEELKLGGDVQSRPFYTVEYFKKHLEWQNEKGQRPVFFIDEAHLVYPNSGTSREILEFFSMSRHAGLDIYFITQNVRKIHRDIRDMVDVTYRCIKLGFMGEPNSFVLKVHEGATSTVINGDGEKRKYEKKNFPLYQSHTMSNVAVTEAAAKVKPLPFKKFIYGGAAFVIFGLIFVFSVGGGKESEQELKPVQVEKVIEQKTKESQVKSVQRPVEKEKFSIKNDNSKHPMYRVTLHISGFQTEQYKDVSRITYIFTASKNGVPIFDVTEMDLFKAGYDVQVYSECSAKLSWGDYEDFIVCDSPKLSDKGETALAALTETVSF